MNAHHFPVKFAPVAHALACLVCFKPKASERGDLPLAAAENRVHHPRDERPAPKVGSETWEVSLRIWGLICHL